MSELHWQRLEKMYLGAPINRIYDPTIQVSEGAALVAMTAGEQFFHSAAHVHGSVLFKLLDDACFFAVSSLVEDVFTVTVSFTTYLVRPVNEGRLTSHGRVVHAGKNLFLAEAVVTGPSGKEIARGNGSFMKSTIRLTPEIGYGAPITG